MVIIKLNNVDWKLLREQKEIVGDIATETVDTPRGESLEGILCLIDHVQDQAAEQLGEEIVFGKEPITKEISIKWCIQDVMGLDDTLTEEQAGAVLDLVKRTHDCEQGITWETLRSGIDDIKNEED